MKSRSITTRNEIKAVVKRKNSPLPPKEKSMSKQIYSKILKTFKEPKPVLLRLFCEIKKERIFPKPVPHKYPTQIKTQEKNHDYLTIESHTHHVPCCPLHSS